MKNEATEFTSHGPEDYDPVFDENKKLSEEELKEQFDSYSNAKKDKIFEESLKSSEVIRDYKVMGGEVPNKSLPKLPKEFQDPRIKKITNWIDANYKKGTKIGRF